LEFLTDFTPETSSATCTALFSAVCELTKPFNCTTPLIFVDLSADDLALTSAEGTIITFTLQEQTRVVLE